MASGMWYRRVISLCVTVGWLFLCSAAQGALLSNAVVIVHGEQSVAPAERGFALSLARHAFRWYREAGVDATMGGDSRLEDLLPGARVALLVQVANPSAPQLALLRRHVQGGGKLIVCYSSSPGLAELMGVGLVGYVRSNIAGRWAEMRFSAPALAGVPESVRQSSPNLFLVKPVAGASQVMAWWYDRAGGRTTEPAWLSCRNGFWMTHVLLGDGDVAEKSKLLLALSAACEPALWGAAADRKLARARQVGTYREVADLMKAARKMEDPQRRAVALAAVKAAEQRETAALAARREGQSFLAWQQAEALSQQMELAYGTLQTPRNGEIRAVWDHSGQGLYPGDWNRTCQVLKEHGISDLYVNVGGVGFSHYRSRLLPPSRLFQEQGDQLAACLAAAKTRGLRVHAWVFCFCTEQCTDERIMQFRNRGWLLTGEDGRERRWLDPAVPEVRSLIVQVAREVVLNYKVDGIHLDFVRYPDFAGSLGPTVRQRFESSTAHRCEFWPAEVKSGARREEFVRWRSDRVSEFVADVRNMLRREGQEKLLSAAVYGKYPSCRAAVGQDWEAWVRAGLVDYLLPMNYTEDPAMFAELVGNQARERPLRQRMLPGIGVTAAESRLRPCQVIDQIRAVRAADCPGFALFDLDTYLEQGVLPVLKAGMTSR